MNAELWRKARDIFDAALERPKIQRLEYVQAAVGDDAELLKEVESLLRSHEEASGFLEDSPAPLLPRTEAPTPEIGQHVGPWLLLREVGEGGTGIVYAAARDDSSYQKLVALKLLRPDRDSREMVRRFRLERQVLASLDHPNIARMLDASTADGVRPYLVMEFVEGIPIDRWCETRNLTIEEVLRLLLQVCDAVGYAHRNLIIHCDLKPANILVTSEGIPKLLDFGIAKLLRPELTQDGSITRAFGRMLTPDYASPEQIRGEPLRTTVDVYALGVLLYRLLTGQLPYEFPSSSMVDIERTVCQVEPRRPSFFNNKLAGDLDAILLMALRKEPHRRYQTVEQLATDIRNYLNELPVTARRGTVAYVTKKFILRHQVAVTATTLGIVLLAAAAGISTYYARIANRRFQQARELTHFVLFRFDDAIRSGQTTARSLLVKEGLEYLKRLSAEAKQDTTLAREMAEGYLKIGDIQGNPFVPNLGDVNGARRSFQNALEQAQQLKDSELIGRAQMRLADVETLAGDRRVGLNLYSDALTQLENLSPSSLKERLRAEATYKIGVAYSLLGDTKHAMENNQRASGIARRLFDQDPQDVESKRIYAMTLERAGQNLVQTGDMGNGIAKLSAALELLEQGAHQSPENEELARRAFACSTVLADALQQSGRADEAERLFRRTLQTAENRLSRDPSNVMFQRDRYVTMARLAQLLETNRAKQTEARQLTKQVLEILAPIVNQKDAGDYELHQYAWLLVKTRFPEFRNPSAAIPYAERAVLRTNSSQPALLDLLACAYAGVGDFQHAIQTERKAIALLPPVEDGGKPNALRKELETNLTQFEKAVSRLPRSLRREIALQPVR